MDLRKPQMAAIALLDDHEYGLADILAALPDRSQHQVEWFASYARFMRDTRVFDILLLDYFLDPERLHADEVFADLRPRAQTIIAFSSSPTANRRLIACGADFAVNKFTPRSSEHLTELFLELL